MSNVSPMVGTWPRWLSRNPPTVSNPSRSIGHVQAIGNFIDVGGAAEDERPVGFLDDRLRLDVVLVANLAEDLFDQILERHKAGGAAVLVDDNRALNALVLELAQQLAHELRLRHEVRRPQVVRDRRVALQRVAQENQILHVDEPENVVEVVAEDRNARVFLLAKQRAKVVERLVCRYRDDVGARRHHFANQRVAEIDDRFQELALLLPGRRARSRRTGVPLMTSPSSFTSSRFTETGAVRSLRE